jgi:aryl-alcohol dehydrogenase-like predicted oxidoreductase
MEYTQLGKSDLIISRVSMGCMSLENDHENNARLLRKAYEKGINFFDTADLYQKGFNEETVGRALKPFRDKVLIATKVGNQLKDDGSGWDWNPTKKYILSAVEKSLHRLQTDHIDLYQLHGGTIDDPIDETIDAFEILKKAGKIRHYGISSIRPNVIREYVKRSSIISVMMQYSLLDRRPEEECLQLLSQHHIGVLVRGSLASGLLISKAPKTYLNFSSDDVAKASATVESVADSQRTKTEVALQYVLQHNAVSSVVVGIHTREQLEAAVSIKHTMLSDEQMRTLKNSLAVNHYTEHR